MDADQDLEAYFARPALAQALDHLGDALLHVRDLPEFACEESWLGASTLTVSAQHGCRLAFYVSARTVAEFYVRMPAKDFTAREYLPTWQPRPALAQRLERVWLGTSRHVVHLSKERVPASFREFSPWDNSFHALRAIGRDCWRIHSEFTEAYLQNDGEYAGRFAEIRDGVRPIARGTYASWELEKRERFRLAVLAIKTPLVPRGPDGTRIRPTTRGQG